jgi:hypothetical protein
MSLNKEKMNKHLPAYYSSNDIESGPIESETKKVDYIFNDLDNMEKGRSMLDLGEDSKAGGRMHKRSRKNKNKKNKATKKGRKSKKTKRKTRKARKSRKLRRR